MFSIILITIVSMMIPNIVISFECNGETPSCTGQLDGFYCYPCDITKYIRCLDGTVNDFDCPNGLEFSCRMRECNFPGIDSTCRGNRMTFCG
ncbi:hypothetical protein B4U80_14880 [Leptotrombidium deliense]|uniref:Chitin-binding type-2 domain-containing protein n=1 Tax=Leptotrombidium deliense TaxID=299467 RepID=A0A443S8J8_9ACAR|nr:hypothetical protein B4U80_14880 [Leptotrombidium deliense]